MQRLRSIRPEQTPRLPRRAKLILNIRNGTVIEMRVECHCETVQVRHAFGMFLGVFSQGNDLLHQRNIVSQLYHSSDHIIDTYWIGSTAKGNLHLLNDM